MAREYERQGITKQEYDSIHRWLKKNVATQSTCEHCQEVRPLENALMRGKRYEMNVDNYLQLCDHCHKRYDLGYDPPYLTEPISDMFIALKSHRAQGDIDKVSGITGISKLIVAEHLGRGKIGSVETAIKILSAFTQIVRERHGLAA